jgi:hypothetical protein
MLCRNVYTRKMKRYQAFETIKKGGVIYVLTGKLLCGTIYYG